MVNPFYFFHLFIFAIHFAFQIFCPFARQIIKVNHIVSFFLVIKFKEIVVFGLPDLYIGSHDVWIIPVTKLKMPAEKRIENELTVIEKLDEIVLTLVQEGCKVHLGADLIE